VSAGATGLARCCAARAISPGGVDPAILSLTNSVKTTRAKEERECPVSREMRSRASTSPSESVNDVMSFGSFIMLLWHILRESQAFSQIYTDVRKWLLMFALDY